VKISFTPLANKWLRDTIQRMKKGPALYLGIGTIIALGGLFSYADAQSTIRCSFSRNLYEGLIGSDVQCLQSYLNSHGFALASSGPGSPGNETQKFGAFMLKAVIAWQTAEGISPATGYSGPLSQSKYEALTTSAAASLAAPAPITTSVPDAQDAAHDLTTITNDLTLYDQQAQSIDTYRRRLHKGIRRKTPFS
jgi:hypothetical protein